MAIGININMNFSGATAGGAGATGATGIAGAGTLPSASAIQNLTNSFTRLNKAIGTTNVGMTRFTTVFRRVALALVSFQVINVVSDSIGRFTRELIKGNAEMEVMRVRLTQFYGSARTAVSALEYVQEVAVKTPFEIPNLVQAITVLKSFGLNAKQYLKLAADTAAATAAPWEDLNTTIVETAIRIGKVAIGSKQAARILPTLRVDQAAYNKALKEGGTRIEALEAGLARFRGTSEALSNTLTGLISNIYDKLGILIRRIGSLAFASIREQVENLFNAIDKIDPASVARIAIKFRDLVNSFMQMGKEAYRFLVRWKEVIFWLLKLRVALALLRSLTTAISGATAIARTFGTVIAGWGGVIGIAAGMVSLVAAEIISATIKAKQFKAEWEANTNLIQNAREAVWQIYKISDTKDFSLAQMMDLEEYRTTLEAALSTSKGWVKQIKDISGISTATPMAAHGTEGALIDQPFMQIQKATKNVTGGLFENVDALAKFIKELEAALAKLKGFNQGFEDTSNIMDIGADTTKKAAKSFNYGEAALLNMLNTVKQNGIELSKFGKDVSALHGIIGVQLTDDVELNISKLKEYAIALQNTGLTNDELVMAASRYATVINDYHELLTAGKISQEEYNRLLAMAKQPFDQLGEALKYNQQQLNTFVNSMTNLLLPVESFFTKMIESTATLKDAMKSLFNEMIRNIIATITRMLVLYTIFQILPMGWLGAAGFAGRPGIGGVLGMMGFNPNFNPMAGGGGEGEQQLSVGATPGTVPVVVQLDQREIARANFEYGLTVLGGR